VQRNGDGQAQVGYSVARQSGGRVMSCTFCTMHKETRSACFLIWPQNQEVWFPGLCLKTGINGLVVCISKSLSQFLGLDVKTKLTTVCRLCHKTDGRRTVWDTC
jgi:hypothetical protein